VAEAATNAGNLGHRSGLVPVSGSGGAFPGLVVVVAPLAFLAVILLGSE